MSRQDRTSEVTRGRAIRPSQPWRSGLLSCAATRWFMSPRVHSDQYRPAASAGRVCDARSDMGFGSNLMATITFGKFLCRLEDLLHLHKDSVLETADFSRKRKARLAGKPTDLPSSLSERTIRQWSAWRMGQALVAHSESGCSFWPALYIPSLVFQTSNKLKHRSVG
jgi:hypothetical protein